MWSIIYKNIDNINIIFDISIVGLLSLFPSKLQVTLSVITYYLDFALRVIFVAKFK